MAWQNRQPNIAIVPYVDPVAGLPFPLLEAGGLKHIQESVGATYMPLLAGTLGQVYAIKTFAVYLVAGGATEVVLVDGSGNVVAALEGPCGTAYLGGVLGTAFGAQTIGTGTATCCITYDQVAEPYFT